MSATACGCEVCAEALAWVEEFFGPGDDLDGVAWRKKLLMSVTLVNFEVQINEKGLTTVHRIDAETPFFALGVALAQRFGDRVSDFKDVKVTVTRHTTTIEAP